MKITGAITDEQREMIEVAAWIIKVSAPLLLLAMLPTIILYIIGIVLIVA
jgi:hypothetical protein